MSGQDTPDDASDGLFHKVIRHFLSTPVSRAGMEAPSDTEDASAADDPELGTRPD